jgi:hypothetical protein
VLGGVALFTASPAGSAVGDESPLRISPASFSRFLNAAAAAAAAIAKPPA